MKLLSIASFSALAFSLTSIFSATEAAAQEPDGVRFRGGVALEAGPLIAVNSFTVGVAGVQGTLGVQINNQIGVYVVPSLDAVFGSVGGINISAALMVDYTLNDNLTFGVGPDVGAFAAIGSSSGGTLSGAGGGLYGGRLHFTWNPIFSRGDNSVRRKGLALGVDLRLLGGGAGYASVSETSTSASASTFVMAPMFTVGYQAF